MTASEATTTSRTALQLIPSQPHESSLGHRDVALVDLHPGDSPRLSGLDADHVQRLIEAGEWPPILVDPGTMRVIDGAHRVQASRELSRTFIVVEFFPGAPSDAFLESVTRNAQHGLPLSARERREAIQRILATHGHLSDRDLARRVGVTHSTVASVRAATPAVGHDKGNHDERRVGRDGRSRPVDPQLGRQRLMDFFAQNPDASLREASQAASVSTGTAKSVRDLVRGAPKKKPQRTTSDTAPTPRSVRLGVPMPQDEALKIVHRLSADPACRRNHSSRALIELLRAIITLTQVVPSKSCMTTSLAQRVGIPEYHHDQLEQVLGACAAWLYDITQSTTSK